MRWSLFIILTLVLSSPVHAREAPFVRWWNSSDEEIQFFDGSHPYRSRVEMKFNSLSVFTGTITPPQQIAHRTGKAFVVFSKPDRTILLVTPNKIMGDTNILNEEFRQNMKKCSGDRAWIVVLPENKWTETDLNPYCTMGYDEEQIRIDLYWTLLSKRPFIDIVTNGLTCIPHHLYGWDRSSRSYVQLSHKCTGARAVERFTGKYDKFLPLNLTGLPPFNGLEEPGKSGRRL